jgi:hypothetical protein
MTRNYQRELFWKSGRAVVHPLPELLCVSGNIWKSVAPLPLPSAPSSEFLRWQQRMFLRKVAGRTYQSKSKP